MSTGPKRTRRNSLISLCAACAAVLWAGAATADGSAPPPANGFAALAALPQGELAALRGREGTTIVGSTIIDMLAEQTLNANVSATNVLAEVVATGPVSLTGNALQGMNGFANVLANSGINSNLQATTAVLVVLQ